jgi:hypothetical protein
VLHQKRALRRPFVGIDDDTDPEIILVSGFFLI